MSRAAALMPSALAYFDRGQRCRFANPAYARWFGLEPAQVVGRSLAELLGPQQYEFSRRHVEAVLLGQPQSFERVSPGPDGAMRHSLVDYLPDMLDSEVIGFSAHATEVTSLKQARADLLDTQQNLGVTLASIEAGFIATDREGRVGTMNSHAEHLTGWPLAEAQGRLLWEVFQREDRPPHFAGRNPVDVSIEEGVTVDAVHHIVLISRDGRRVPLEAKAAVTRDEGGQPRGLAIVFRDITRLMQAEADSRRLAAIVESSGDAIIGKTLDGRITSWNRAAQSMFGYTAEEAVGQSIRMLIPPERIDEEMRILTDIAQGIGVSTFDTQRRAKAGHLVDVSLSISPIRDGRGSIVGASKIARDITARQRTRQLEAENRQIQEASRLKSLFLANMSHELRTPLNAIIGFADLLHRGTVPPDSPKHQAFLGHIASSGRHLLQLINDVLDLAKIESGKFEFFPEPIDLPQLVKEALDVLQMGISRKRLQVQTQIEPTLDGLVLDPSRLKQVLYNYLSNAIKFTPEGGRVTVRARAAGPRHFRLEVEDTGIGIDAAGQARLFTDFQQLDSGYSKQHQGTGLGLALTRRLVHAQGGQVGVRSSPGLGSVFHVQMNRVHGTDEPLDPAAPVSREGLERRRLLLIEPDAQVHGRLAQGLAEAGFDVDTAPTARHALQHSSNQRYDGLTLDLALPDADGLGLLARLRAQPTHRQVPVLGLTVPGATSGAAAAFGIANILDKPLRVAEVAGAMRGLPRRADRPPRVMVIDDEFQALELMRATLESLQIEAQTFADGRLALAVMEDALPDAIVLDLMMPGFNGFEVLEELRQRPATRHIPVFIWTSMLLTDDEYRQLSLTAQGILAKGGGALSALLASLVHWRAIADQGG